MARRQRKLKSIERLWRERFGEPPSLRTDPDLMLRILETLAPSAQSEGGGGPRADTRVVEGAKPALAKAP